MKLINFAIHRNIAPSVPDSPFKPVSAPNDLVVTFAVQIEDEAVALNFASDIMKIIEQYRK